MFFGLLTIGLMVKELKPYYELSPSLAVSAAGTVYVKEVEASTMVPRGAAVLTGAGRLEGIKYIVHAAPGAMTRSGPQFSPTLEGLRLSLKNSLILAEKKQVSCLAVPFIGGGIFLNALGIKKAELAQEIVAATKSGRVKYVVLPEDKQYFPAAIVGSILDFKLHKCEAIINAANMEVTFGGGLSGAIGSATKEAAEINRQARELIRKYYSQL